MKNTNKANERPSAPSGKPRFTESGGKIHDGGLPLTDKEAAALSEALESRKKRIEPEPSKSKKALSTLDNVLDTVSSTAVKIFDREKSELSTLMASRKK